MAKRRKRHGMRGIDGIATIDSWGIDAIDALITPSQLKEHLWAATGGGIGLVGSDLLLDKLPVAFFHAGIGRAVGKGILATGGGILLSKYLSHPAGLGWVGAVGGDVVRILINKLRGMGDFSDADDDLLLRTDMGQDPDLLPSDLSAATDVETATPSGFSAATMVESEHPTGFSDGDESDLSWMS